MKTKEELDMMVEDEFHGEDVYQGHRAVVGDTLLGHQAHIVPMETGVLLRCRSFSAGWIMEFERVH
jgi:hypothetical protein